MSCCRWKERYQIVEKMLILKMTWSFGEEGAKKLIRSEVDFEVRNRKKFAKKHKLDRG